MSGLLLSEMRYSFNPEDSQIWYPEIKNSNGPYIKKGLLQYNPIKVSNQTGDVCTCKDKQTN
jgi:hypothetical protein